MEFYENLSDFSAQNVPHLDAVENSYLVHVLSMQAALAGGG